jgi:hypothetical protein
MQDAQSPALAGMRQLDARPHRGVEQGLAAATAQAVDLSLVGDLDLGLVDTFGWRQLGGRRGRRILLVGQRREALDVDLRRVHLDALQRCDAGLHEGAWAADEGLAAPERLRELCQLGHRRHALHRVEPVDHHQPRRVGAGERRELAPEDHRALVAVGVDQRDAALALREHRPQDREDRRDAAAAGEQQEVAVERARREDTGRGQHLEQQPGFGVVAQPVGAAAAIDPLDRHPWRVVHRRRARHRIAARQVPAGHR